MSLKLINSVIGKRKKWALAVFVFVGLFHSFIANDKFVIAKTENGVGFFVDKSKADWGVAALIPYSSHSIDRENRSVGPLSNQNIESVYKRHWLGTDSLGRDVLAGMLNGTFIALIVGASTVILSFILGVVLAFISGYYGDSGFRVEKRFIIPLIFISILLIFYIVYSGVLMSLILILILMALWFAAAKHSRRGVGQTLGVPLDMIVFRFLDVFNSIPGMFLVLILLALFKKASIINVVFVIAILKWPVITRHLRAEILKIKQEDYIDSAKSIGLSDLTIFIKHVLPMAVSPVVIVLAFGFSSAVLMESTLSFLGIGLPVDEVSWGSIIRQARQDFSLWWLAVFPGIAIYFTVVLFNSIGNSLNKKLRMEA